MKQKVIESFRPLINTACVKNPFVVPVLRNAAASIATTEQTAQLLRAAGAKNVHTVFPDVTQDQREFDEVVSHRQLQSETIQQRCELVFSGRALWWKGCDVALLVLKKLVQKGCSVRFTVVSGGGDAVAGWKKCAAQLQLEPYVTWLDFMPKKDLLSLYENSHAFLYPTMHDSSSSAIPEAYSTGLPSVTLGIGGAGTASTSQTGFNEFHDTAELWATKAAERIREWTQTPSTWLAASLAARKHADSFSISGIKTFLSDYREWK
jgi:glycosyltransferase involved in cell wall biosynthesis